VPIQNSRNLINKLVMRVNEKFSKYRIQETDDTSQMNFMKSKVYPEILSTTWVPPESGVISSVLRVSLSRPLSNLGQRGVLCA
ncbi:MAG: hypothetical protein ACC651_14090, partial [Candidatus Scalindua sp.]